MRRFEDHHRRDGVHDSLDQVTHPFSANSTLLMLMRELPSGFICLSTPSLRLSELDLPPLHPSSGKSQDPKGTAYHLTLDASSSKHPTTTGISAHDRALTSRLIASGAGPEEFTRPGHLVTLRYTPGGTRKRRGHTEAAVGMSDGISEDRELKFCLDLCKLAGEAPAGLLCELVHPTDPSGQMARRDDCWRFAKEWGLRIISVDALAEYICGEGGGLVPER